MWSSGWPVVVIAVAVSVAAGAGAGQLMADVDVPAKVAVPAFLAVAFALIAFVLRRLMQRKGGHGQ